MSIQFFSVSFKPALVYEHAYALTTCVYLDFYELFHPDSKRHNRTINAGRVGGYKLWAPFMHFVCCASPVSVEALEYLTVHLIYVVETLKDV